METENPVAEQPTADSATEERIASLFGGAEPAEQPESASPEDAPEAEAPQVTEPETFELEIEGEKFTLPKKLEKGFMQERDYTQKAQSLAEQRRTIDLQLHQQRIAQLSTDFNKDVAQEMQDMAMLDAVIRQTQSQDVSGFDLDKLIRHRMDLDNLKERRSTLQQSVDKKRQEWGQKQSEEIAKLRTQSLEAISKRIPGWNESLAKSIREHALSEGYTETELNQILDPRHVMTLWKAQQFDQLKAKATPAIDKAKSVKTTAVNPMPKKTQEYLNFRKTVTSKQPSSPEYRQALSDRIASKFGA